MNIFRRWLGDPEGLERAKRADEQATERLVEAKEELAQAEQRVQQVRAGWAQTILHGLWAERTAGRNHLTERFFDELHGGNT